MITLGARQRWLWAVVIAAAVLGGLRLLFRAPPTPTRSPPSAKANVQLDTSGALREEVEFFDPTPMFLPTKFNAAPKQVTRREPGSAFPDYAPKSVFAVVELKLDSLALPKAVEVPARPAEKPGEVLALDAPGSLALGFGRTDAPVPPLVSRGAIVEIVAADSGRRVPLPPALSAAARPPGSAAWQPLEFIAAVDAAGLVGPVVLTTRSGADEVDNYFQNYLARTLRVGERLAPGFYRISVGP